MSWDIDAMSVLPEAWQSDIVENFSHEYLAERLSDYIRFMSYADDEQNQALKEAIKNGSVLSNKDLSEFQIKN